MAKNMRMVMSLLIHVRKIAVVIGDLQYQVIESHDPNRRHPREPDGAAVSAFFDYLAVEGRLHIYAKPGIGRTSLPHFIYREALCQELGYTYLHVDAADRWAERCSVII